MPVLEPCGLNQMIAANGWCRSCATGGTTLLRSRRDRGGNIHLHESYSMVHTALIRRVGNLSPCSAWNQLIGAAWRRFLLGHQRACSDLPPRAHNQRRTRHMDEYAPIDGMPTQDSPAVPVQPWRERTRWDQRLYYADPYLASS
jgi:hypothetical protein